MLDKLGNDAEKAYIVTYTGKQFHLLAPRLEEIDIIDIAHALALQCRWTGHCKYPYSVAQHCYYCSFLGPDTEAFDRLMHDASEAYCSDMNRPLKHYTQAGAVYRQIEDKIQKIIAERFGFAVVPPPSVKLADNSMLYAEKNQLVKMNFAMSAGGEKSKRYDENNGVKIEQWTYVQAEQMFLNRFNELYSWRVN